MGARVLIVEDDFLLAQDLGQRLSEAGHVVVGLAARAEEALEIAERTAPDLAIVDIRLAGALDGISVGQFLHERGVAVIHLTARFERALIEARGYAADLLAKPVDDRDLFAAIARAFRR
jgi:DNA-binding response OmpR family regulator